MPRGCSLTTGVCVCVCVRVLRVFVCCACVFVTFLSIGVILNFRYEGFACDDSSPLPADLHMGSGSAYPYFVAN